MVPVRFVPPPESRIRTPNPRPDGPERPPLDAARDSARLLRSLDVDAFLADPRRKQRLVTPMFDLIAPRYDDFTRRFSFGMDRHWKRDAVNLVARVAPRGGAVVDIACGTGDIALAVTDLRPDLAVTGVDASSRMLAIAATRSSPATPRRLRFVQGDLARLPLRDSSVDVISGGYAIRNAPARGAALDELARVVRPGGHLVTLDFYRPRFTPWRWLYLGYLSAAGSVVGWLWHRLPMAYSYIASSIDHFVSWEDFATDLDRAGFKVAWVGRRLGGGIAIHHAVRR
jgi:demethylmenaquinone methyltransferase/2-methoxy-6-polyprenyl-1,4-benzoquinol methylase